MLIAQSAWTTAAQTVPVAALTTVALGAVLAPWIARRQEAGKKQAEAEANLRQLVLEKRAEVVYAREGLDASSTYDPSRFTGRLLASFATSVVSEARKLRKRQQREVREALVQLVGEWRVEVAEQVGPSLDRVDEHASFGNERVKESVLFQYQRRAIERLTPEAEVLPAAVIGYLGVMERSALPHEDHPAALAAFDRLVTAVGGAPKLGA
ncbi:hypothetical protein [Streptomyces racemochromogenes]|uniref:hypothetical protein n=1 Tax=Streptomyces racemochromogenes TaxID=67353 RepID=UPI0031F0899E